MYWSAYRVLLVVTAILILMLLLQAIVLLLVQLWVHLVSLSKVDNEITIYPVSFPGDCG